MNENLIELLESSINNIAKPYKKVIFVCIGTDRSTGDCYGPMVGTFLKRQGFNVYGTLHNPVHAKNLELVLSNIDLENNLIIAVDACLGKIESIGKIRSSNTPINPGSAVDKQLPRVGDVSIIGIVAESSAIPFMTLQNVRLSFVFNLAKTTTEAICNVLLKEY